MSVSSRPIRVWLIDPISYSGMAYSDVGQIQALTHLGTDVTLAGSDHWMLDPGLVPRLTIFTGTHGDRSRLLKGLAYLASLTRLLWRVLRERPDIVHWQYSQMPVADVAAMSVIQWLGAGQVYTAHELLPWTTRSYHRRLFRRLYQVVDAIVVHGPDQQRELETAFDVPHAKVHIAPLGGYAAFTAPGLPQERARGELGLPGGQPIALFFGTIRPSKGLGILLRAWQAVVAELPEAILLVVGKPSMGESAADVSRSITDLGIAASTQTRFEQVDPDDANAYYRAADVVVIPYEAIGTSGVLRYSFDSGRAVVATAVGEHRVHVLPGETGFLVSPGDAVELAATLVRALRDRPELERMGRAALTYAAREFPWLDPARKLADVYAAIRSGTSRRKVLFTGRRRG